VGGGVAATLALGLAVASAAPSGALRHVETEENAALSNSSDVTVSRDGRNVYGVGFNGSSIGVFTRNANTGAITFVEEQNGDDLENPESIIVSRDGDNAYVTGNFSNSIHAYTRGANGTLSFLESETDGVSGVDGLNGAYDLVAVGNQIYATGPDDAAVALFNRLGDGSLQWADAFIDGGEGIDDMDEPHGITASPDGRNIYVASDDNGAIVVFRRFTETGQLDFVESETLGSDGNDAEVSPDGSRVYVASDDGVRTFRRNSGTGALTLIGLTNSIELSSVFGLAASPGGEDVYASSGDFLTPGIATLKTTRNAALRFLEFDENDELDSASATELSPDARHVYVSGGGNNDGKIGVYSRQPELVLKGKKKQDAGEKLKVKAECSADCTAKLKAKGYKPAKKKLTAGKPKTMKLTPKDSAPDGGKVKVKGKGVAGNRSDKDRLKITLK
jgi:6-phosphogluconolactonase (cycloisomerase 2 family)